MPRSETRVEMLKVRITFTATGYPVDLKTAEVIYGTASNAPEPGWFWIGATPKAAASMRKLGHRVVGSLTTTWFPPDDGRSEDEVPIHGSVADVERRLKEVGTEERMTENAQEIADQEYIDAAMRDYGSDEILIQQQGMALPFEIVDRVSNGAWVVAWIFIPDGDV